MKPPSENEPKPDSPTDRRVPRIHELFTAYVEVDGRPEPAIARDLSEYGLFLQTNRLKNVGDRVTFELEASEQPIPLQGRVVTTRDPGKGALQQTHFGMGVVLESPPPEYLRLLEDIRGGTLSPAGRRVETRFDVTHRVQFESVGAFLTEYSINLSHGGCYIATRDPYRPGTFLQLKLEIPGAPQPLEIRGRVAHHVDPERALATGARPGIGVQFVELSPEAAEIIRGHLRTVELVKRGLRETQAGEIPSSGSLGVYLLPQILLQLLRTEATGLLKVARREISKTVFVRRGSPVYVETNLPSESLGAFLVEKGVLTPKDLEISLREHARNDLHHGEILLRGGMLDAAALSTGLLETHEMRLSNLFPWFDGRFEFEPLDRLPAHAPTLPMRIYPMIFTGARRWFDRAVAQVWIGLEPDAVLTRVAMPPPTALVPPGVIRLLNRLFEPRTFEELCGDLKVPPEVLSPVAFVVVLAGWVDVAGPVVAVPVEEAAGLPAAETAAVKPHLLKEERFLGEHASARGQDFLELLGVTPGVHEAVLGRKYVERVRRYADFEKDADLADDVRKKIKELGAWCHVAYETLRTPMLRRVYWRRLQGFKGKPMTPERREADMALLGALVDLEQRQIDAAAARLKGASRKYPEDLMLTGYLGWVLFQIDPEKCGVQASEMLDRALARDRSDCDLHFFRGKIHAYQKRWTQAEMEFETALLLESSMQVAKAALDRARAGRRASEHR